MHLPPLIRGKLKRRYKRFLADVVLSTGEVVVAHCANPGAMTGLKEPGLTVWLSKAHNPKRKLKYDWQLVEHNDGRLVGINTANPNRIVYEALQEGRIAEAAGYPDIRREVKYGTGSRVDFLATGEGQDLYIEVKNVHLNRLPHLAEFPDSVTERGSKHLRELSEVAQSGHRALMLYVIQHEAIAYFTLAGDIDPTYAHNFAKAREAGVEAAAYICAFSRPGRADASAEITLQSRVPFLHASDPEGAALMEKLLPSAPDS